MIKRKLIIGERLMYVDAETPVNCVFAVKITGIITPERLKNALYKIQRRHELLRMRIDEEEEGGPYFIINPVIKEIPVEIKERKGEEDWLAVSKEAWYMPFNRENEPLARIIWLQSPAGAEQLPVSDLLWVLPHCTCDGNTCIALMRELLTLLDNPDLQLQHYCSFSSVRELMPGSFFASKGKMLKIKLFSKLGKLFFYFKKIQNEIVTGSDYALHWKLSEEQTKALTRLASAEKTSVHSALCVAFMKSFYEITGDRAHGKVICPVDIRRYITQIKPDHMFAFAPIAELTMDHRTTIAFWERARMLRAALKKKVNAIDVYDMLWLSEQLHTSVNKMVRFLKSTKGTHDITLSNMGKLRIPENYETFNVDTIYSPTIAFPWRNPTTLAVTIFKGQMDFALMSNDGFLSEAEASQIREKAMGFLFTASALTVS